MVDNTNYTYLIGDLAIDNFLSYQSTKDVLFELKKWIENIINNNKLTLLKEDKIIIDKFLIDLNWINGEYDKNNSFEALVKSVYENENIENIIRFKSIINSLILVEDIKKKSNIKYENFFRDICERDRYANIILPENIKILTWNRGINLERAFYEISQTSDTLFKDMQIYPISAGFNDTDFNIKRFALIHLRGLAGAYYINKNKMISEYLKDWITIRDMKDSDILKNLVISYKSFIYNNFLVPTISFFLDNSDNVYQNLVNQKSLHIASKTNTLIIVGHTFENDTFEKDKEIIQQMIDLKKIYVQIPTEYKQSIFLKLKKMRPDINKIEIEFIDNDMDLFIHDDLINVYEEL